MPFIDSKITVKVSEEKREKIKAELGKAAAIIGKPESFLMVGFEDEYSLYFAGNKLEKGAYVSVDVFGSVSSSAADKMTARICEIYEEVPRLTTSPSCSSFAARLAITSLISFLSIVEMFNC